MPANTNEWQKSHAWEPSPTSHPEPIPLLAPSDLVNPLLRIGDVMSRDIPGCPATASLEEGARALHAANACAVYVMDGTLPIGVLTERAVVHALADAAHPRATVTVRDLAETGFPTVKTEDRLDVLFEHFSAHGVLATDKNGHPQGVVRWQDLLGALSERALGHLLCQAFSSSAVPDTRVTSKKEG